MSAVSATEGIQYGFKMMLYFIAVIVIGLIITSIGIGMVTSALQGFYGVNTGQLLIGGVLSLGGILTIYAGTIGALYKVIADGVLRGNQAAS